MIDSYQFGQIFIDGKDYYYDVMVDWQGKVEKWWRKESHKVAPEDIKQALDLNPEVIVIGTGDSGIAEVLAQTQEIILNKGIGIFVGKTSEAVKRFNNHLNKNKKVVGLFHLTC